MPELLIDGRRVEAPEGATLLQAASLLGISIPTLCFDEGLPHHTSCMVCLVEDLDEGRLVPACVAPAQAGRRVQTTGPRVARARRRSVELLMAEHAGDCEAPCVRACPAHADIPGMMRRLAEGDREGALRRLLARLPLAGSLARACPAPCRKVCRRRLVDSPLDICGLQAAITGVPGSAAAPAGVPASGRRVAIVGAGPAGLSTAYFLARAGHRCVALDERPVPGGMLRLAVPDPLPVGVLDADIGLLQRMGIELRPGSLVGAEELETLRRTHHAVVLATGSPERLEALLPRGARVDAATGACSIDGVFACGNAVRVQLSRMAVRAVADGRKVAHSVGRFLAGLPVTPEPRRFDSRLGVIGAGDLEALAAATRRRAGLRASLRQRNAAPAWAVEEALRCLQCDCARQRTCRLRECATALGADARRFSGDGERRLDRMAGSNGLTLEHGKCIKCGICVRIAEAAGDRPGLAFSGRGSETRVCVPLGGDLGDALPTAADACVSRCPTGAFAWDR
jgi:ferredoxin